MSSFFCRTMIFLLVVDLNRSFASIYYDNVTDTEYEVISLEKKKFQFISIIDVSPYRVMSITTFGQFFVLLSYHFVKAQNHFTRYSHVRIYEYRHPFNLLFVISTDDIRGLQDVVWNQKTKSLFMRSSSTGIWELSWEDHMMRKFPCPSKVIAGSISFSNDGHVLIIGEKDNLLYVCNINATLIRKISFVNYEHYKIRTTFGQYRYSVAYYDPRLNDRNVFNVVDLRLGEMNDFILNSILDVNECNSTSKNTKRLSLFIIRQIPGKDDFDLFNLTIERRNNTKKYLAAEFRALDERLLGEFLSNKGEKFYYFKCKNDPTEKWCFAPLASNDQRAAIRRAYKKEGPNDPVLSKWFILYYYDSDKHQLIAGVSNLYSDDQRIYILIL